MCHSDAKTVQNLIKICTNLLVLNLPNEEDYLVLETDVRNEHWFAVVKIKEGENSANFAVEVLIRQNAIMQ